MHGPALTHTHTHAHAERGRERGREAGRKRGERGREEETERGREEERERKRGAGAHAYIHSALLQPNTTLIHTPTHTKHSASHMAGLPCQSICAVLGHCKADAERARARAHARERIGGGFTIPTGKSCPWPPKKP